MSDAALAAMTFLFPGVTIEVEVTTGAVQGQVVPPRHGRIRLERWNGPGAEARVEVDGWFRLGPPPPRGFRLVLGAGGGSLRTPWVGRRETGTGWMTPCASTSAPTTPASSSRTTC